MTRPLIALAVAIAVIAIAVFALRSPSPTGVDSAKNTSSPSSMASQASAAGAPAANKAPAALAQAAGAPADPVAPADAPKPWTTQPVKADANASTRSVAEAIRTNQHPERLSMLVAPKAFSAQDYARDPAAYLNTVEPGRVFQTAQPGPDVPALTAQGPTAARIRPGESVILKVKAVPGQPVAWTSTDLGSFDNLLTAITVAADADGVAKVTFNATPGVSHIAHIIAGSPVCSGQVNFQVDVQTQGLHPVATNPAPAVQQP